MEHEDSVELLIFDVVMPKRNGKEAYEAIRAVKEGIKVLFISGYTGDVVLDKGVATESNYLSKPITAEELLRKVRNLLDENGP
jgi:two-component SAPR family response regulator